MGDCWNLVLGFRPMAAKYHNSEILIWPIHACKGVGLKFSTTLLVERELELLIR